MVTTTACIKEVFNSNPKRPDSATSSTTGRRTTHAPQFQTLQDLVTFVVIVIISDEARQISTFRHVDSTTATSSLRISPDTQHRMLKVDTAAVPPNIEMVSTDSFSFLLHQHIAPPWRAELEDAIRKNYIGDQCFFYVSLATIKPWGRPANRSVYFRGFMDECGKSFSHVNTPMTYSTESLTRQVSHLDLNDPTGDREGAATASSPTSPTTPLMMSPQLEGLFAGTMHDTPGSYVVEEGGLGTEALRNVIVFVMDARRDSIEDLLHGSRFGEVCWFMPHTKEQWRLSGTLHLVAPPDHPLTTMHSIPPPFSDRSDLANINWETKRLEVWRCMSNTRRASFTWPKSGTPRANKMMVEYLTQLSIDLESAGNDQDDGSGSDTPPNPQQQQQQQYHTVSGATTT
ncbi:hypothetical protein HK102_006183, partial [Quaeritorhiza haematococci]